MGAIYHWINLAREAILDAFSLVSYFDLLIFVGCFLVFVLFYFLSCMLNRVRFFIPQFFKLLAYVILFATPIVVVYINQNILYQSEVQYKMAKRLEYTPTYFVDGTIYNRGKKDIKHCYFVLEVLRNPKAKLNLILNQIYPLKTYRYEIETLIKVDQSYNFQKTFNDFPYKYFEQHLYCYGGR